MWLPDFIYNYFAAPLNISHYHVNLDEMGNAYMGGGIQMRPRDFMKLGQLFLNGANGTKSRSWTKVATEPHVSIYAKGDYGYAWWLREFQINRKVYKTYRAAGNGGQLVIVYPDLDLVVAFTGGNYSQGPIWWKWPDEVVPKFIVPALLK